MIDIYCDGACRGNPGETGSGVVVFGIDGEKRFSGGYSENGTNNVAELQAFIKALDLAKEIIEKGEKCKISADSQYVINSVTNWSYSWKKNGWHKKGGIKNLELIKEAHEKYDSLKDSIEVNYVPGHSGFNGNEIADSLANKAIDEKISSWVEV